MSEDALPLRIAEGSRLRSRKPTPAIRRTRRSAGSPTAGTTYRQNWRPKRQTVGEKLSRTIIDRQRRRTDNSLNGATPGQGGPPLVIGRSPLVIGGPPLIKSLRFRPHTSARGTGWPRLSIVTTGQSNAAAMASPPRSSATKAPQAPTWTPERLRAFLDRVSGHHHGAFFRLAALTGLRPG